MPVRVLRLAMLALPMLAAFAAAVPAPAGGAEQVAALRLQAEVAAEAACMVPPDGEQPAAVARLDARPAVKADFCRCFAAAVARNAPPADQAELIEAVGVPPDGVAAAARARCLARLR